MRRPVGASSRQSPTIPNTSWPTDIPEVALLAADIIRDLVPDAGHMAHMPTHIDVLVGEYWRSIASNHKATVADDKFFKTYGGVNVYSFTAGQRSLALESIDYMESTMTEEMLRLHSPPMADWLEFFLAMRVHVLIRFGMWDELLALQMPEDQDMYCVTAVMRHYGKGIAYASTSNLAKAHEQRQLFRDAAKRVPPSRLDYPNTIVDVVKVATAMLDGEIGYRHGNYEVAFASCRHLQSVPLLTPGLSAEDALTYTESWGWMLPARHPYGALSLEQGLVEQAATAYAEDLGLAENLVRAHQLPRNVWALHGYHECLVRLGRNAEALIIKKLLIVAQAEADVSLRRCAH
ncbi:hypothetical protein BDW62DRAFT_211906 [Aspergillus aurantiobrunneus]